MPAVPYRPLLVRPLRCTAAASMRAIMTLMPRYRKGLWQAPPLRRYRKGAGTVKASGRLRPYARYGTATASCLCVRVDPTAFQCPDWLQSRAEMKRTTRGPGEKSIMMRRLGQRSGEIKQRDPLPGLSLRPQAPDRIGPHVEARTEAASESCGRTPLRPAASGGTGPPYHGEMRRRRFESLRVSPSQAVPPLSLQVLSLSL
jgi:hypothetical protein